MFTDKLSIGCANVNINYDYIFELNCSTICENRWRLSTQNYWNEMKKLKDAMKIARDWR